jgi:hypothetical protein
MKKWTRKSRVQQAAAKPHLSPKKMNSNLNWMAKRNWLFKHEFAIGKNHRRAKKKRRLQN